MCAIAKDGSQTLSFLQHDDSSLLVLFAGAYGGCSPCQVVEAEAPITTHARYRANGGGFRRQLIIKNLVDGLDCRLGRGGFEGLWRKALDQLAGNKFDKFAGEQHVPVSS